MKADGQQGVKKGASNNNPYESACYKITSVRECAELIQRGVRNKFACHLHCVSAARVANASVNLRFLRSRYFE